MKVVEDSPSQLVLKESALKGQLIGGLFAIVGLIVMVVPFVTHKSYGVIALGLIFVVIGVLAAFFSKADTVVADKTSRQLTVTFKSLKKQGQAQQCSFDDVAAVQLSERYQNNYMGNNAGMPRQGVGMGGISFGTGGVGFGGGGMNGMQSTTQMNLAVLLKNGTVWTLANEQRSGGMGVGVSTGGRIVGVGQRLAAAIGAPFQQNGATPGQLLQAVEHRIEGAPQPPVSTNTVPPTNSVPNVLSPQPPSPGWSPSPPPAPTPPAYPGPSAPPDSTPPVPPPVVSSM